MENDRLDELYLPMGGLGGQKPEMTPKNAKKLVFIKKMKFSFFCPYTSLEGVYTAFSGCVRGVLGSSSSSPPLFLSPCQSLLGSDSDLRDVLKLLEEGSQS